MPWFYTDRESAFPGEQVVLFGSSEVSPCRLRVHRVGAERVCVATFEVIDLPNAPTPKDADRHGCGWPEVFRFEIGEDWKTGYYDLELSAPGGTSSHHFVCVKRAPSAPRAKAVMVLNTNTYQAYNYWGGANSYAHVDKLMSGELSPEDARDAAIGTLSRLRPYAQNLMAPPDDAPRLVNPQPRAKGEPGIPFDLQWFAQHRPSPYDGSAGFVGKWEQAFATWCEANGIELDYLTDHDLEAGVDLLRGYPAVLLVGHSEYWSQNEREAIEAYVDAGGHLAIFSGNTAYWKVRWEDEGRTLIAHKWKGETEDPLWADVATRQEATHLWSHPEFARPEAEITGLSFIYGGYHRLGLCVARGTSAYTVYDDQHWALADTDLYYGDAVGGDVPLLGYENDGCLLRFDERGLPVVAGGVGVPPDLSIIAIAPATLAESDRSPYPPIIPPEQPGMLARCAFGEDSEANRERLMRGHAVMASFTRGDGEVFNAGTTEWAHGLAAGDPFVDQITRNVLRRFGVI